ncbi:MAG: phosphatidate cytidylyltransferase [Rickettsiales bacterium]|jgi:phosphatidate cytidylyltransferase|nr:phosphatidate cytidylyltransferase [Rickettsiales bacterium]
MKSIKKFPSNNKVIPVLDTGISPNKIPLSCGGVPRRSKAKADGVVGAGTNTAIRILSSLAILAAICIAAITGAIGILALGAVIIALMIYEWLKMTRGKLPLFTTLFGTIWLLLMATCLLILAPKIWVMLTLLITIVATDTGGWFFGSRMKTAKLFPDVSAGKTWGGHIAGFICGTIACFAAGSLAMDMLTPQLIWIGMGIATLAQYGDLTESYFKRRCGVKDSSNLIPGHGGFLDRFDGWLYALPLMTLISELL